MRTTSKNRDRRGGHKSTLLTSPAGIVGYTPSERAFIKRITKKKMRRQHKRAVHEAMIQHDNDLDYAYAELMVDRMNWDDYEAEQNYREYLEDLTLDEDYISGYSEYDYCPPYDEDDDYFYCQPDQEVWDIT